MHTEFRDLDEAQFRHYPPFAYDKTLPAQVTASMVGWVGDRIPATGQLDETLDTAIHHFALYHYIDEGDLGCHTCRLCKSYSKRGEILFALENMYIAPQMLVHYIRRHDYLPPQAFVTDLRRFWESDASVACRSQTCCERAYNTSFDPECNG